MSLQRIHAITQVALISALALILSYLETMIPLPLAVPGIKLGLANVAVLIALFHLGWREAAGVAMVKVLAAGLLFGSPMMLAYSACGMVLAYLCMILLRLVPGMGIVPISMASAIFHNVGQLVAASLMLGSWAVFATLPLLALAACATGALVGVVTQSVLSCLESDSSQRPAVDLAGFAIKPGEHVAFIGANGSGKTTAALQIAGLTEVCSRDSFSDAAIVFQNPDDQIVEGVVAHDVAFGLENKGVSRDEMLKQVQVSLEKTGQLDAKDKSVAELSGGQKQNVAIAGAYAFGSQTVVFDESTAMLDVAARLRHQDLVDALLAEGKSVITVTQLLDEALKADRVIVFSQCRIVMQATPDELVRQAQQLAKLGIGLTPVIELALELRQKGVAVSLTDNVDVLEKELSCLLARK